MTQQVHNSDTPKPSWYGKLCPFLPFVPVGAPSPLSARQQTVNIAPMPCQGENCAVFDTCQGDSSPKAAQAKLASLLKEYGPILNKVAEAFQKASKNPLISRFLS